MTITASTFQPPPPEEILTYPLCVAKTISVHVCLQASQRSLGVALYTEQFQSVKQEEKIDNKHGIMMGELLENESFDNLAHLLRTYPCADYVLSTHHISEEDQQCINQTFKQQSIQYTSCKMKVDAKRDVHQLFDTFIHRRYADQSYHLSQKLMASIALCNLAPILARIDECHKGNLALSPFLLKRQYVQLDTSALQALNAFESSSDFDKNASLYGLLNRTKTPMAAQLLKSWIKQPLMDLAKITRRLDFVELLSFDSSLRDSIIEILRGFPDIEKLVKNLKAGRGNIKLLISLYSSVKKLEKLLDVTRGYRGKHQELFQREIHQKLQSYFDEFGKYMELIQETIDLAAINSHEYHIKPNYHPELANLSLEKDKLSLQLDQLVRQASKLLSVDVKLTDSPQHGYHFRVSRAKGVNLGSSFKLLDTRKDGIRFTNKQMQSTSEEYFKACKLYEEQQEDIVKKVCEVAQTYTDVFLCYSNLLAELDIFASFAHVAVNAPTKYVRPTMKPFGYGCLSLQQARHPCVELMPNVNFIPNDIIMNTGQNNVQIITGPNTGGKSTYIRQAGVIVLMAHIGSFVPCEEATITIVDSILARVGAGDAATKGVSTFMKEMLEASAIVRASTADSLVIIDELGRGTSTYDGFGVAWSIAEHVAKELHSFCLFATHFYELTSLADRVPCVHNRHVVCHASDDSINMLYRVEDGPSDRSFGVHVAQIARFPQEVIDNARQKAHELEKLSSGFRLNDDDAMDTSDTKSHVYTSTSKRISPDPLTTDTHALDLLPHIKRLLDMPADQIVPENAKLRATFLQDVEQCNLLSNVKMDNVKMEE